MTAIGRFVVGTGRCGSTLLSRMLRCHPRVLELSEFFVGLDWNQRFQREPISGGAYAELLRAPHALMTLVLQRGHLPDEVPLVAALPPLADDPDQLFDVVLERSACQELQPPGGRLASAETRGRPP